MGIIFLVFLIGTSINVANDHPHNMADVHASILKQIEHPVLGAGGPYNQ